MLRTVLVEDAEALDRLGPDWWTLWRRCPEGTPFQSPAWLLPWWQVFAPGRLATVAVWAGERLAALAPSYVETVPLGSRLLPLGIGISDHLDVLIDPEASVEVAGALAGGLAEIAGIARWEFEELRPGACARRLPLPSGFSETGAPQSACPVLPLGGPEGLDRVPARQRRKLRMAQHRTARRGGEVATVGTADLDEALAELERLHAARWIRRGEPGVLATDAVRRFHRAALPRLAANDLADLRTLRIEGRTAGVYYGLRQPGSAYAYLGGFDPDFAFESPGTVLLGRALADAAASGCGEFHLLRGQEPYKYAWGAADRWNGRRSWSRDEVA